VVLKSNWVTDDVFEADDANDISTQVNANTAKLESGSTTGLPFVVDEDDMASNSAFKIPTQQSVKAYVDTSYLLKANLASPTFTGTVGGITKSMVGLGNVDNTADTAKPVSTAQQTALDLKLNAADASVTNTRTPTDGTVTTAKFAASALVTAAEGLAGNDNDTTIPTSAAVLDAIAGGAIPLTEDRFIFDGTGLTATHPTTSLSGHTLSWAGAGTTADFGGGLHGFFVTPTPGGAFYMQSALSSNIQALSCGFSFVTYGTDTNGAAITLAATNMPIDPGDPDFRMSAHVFTTRTAMTVTLWDASGPGQIILAGFTYDNPLQIGKKYEFGWIIEDDTLVLQLPDGQVRSVTDSRIGDWLAPNFFAESFTAASTDSIAVVHDVWASTVPERLAIVGNSGGSGGGTPDDGSVTTAKFAGSALVTAAEGLNSSDNDTSVPTTAAVIDAIAAAAVAGVIQRRPGVTTSKVRTGMPVTFVSSSSASTISGGVSMAALTSPAGKLEIIGADTSDLVVIGGQAGYLGPAWRVFSDGTSGTTGPTSPLGLDFYVSGTRYVEFKAWSYAGGAVLIYVDDEPLSAVPMVPSPWTSNAFNTFKIDLGDAKTHRIRVLTHSMGIGSVWGQASGTMWAPSDVITRVAVLGDSMSEGTGMNTGTTVGTWLEKFANMAGIRDWWNGGVGGTGPNLVNGSYPNFKTRATTNIVGTDANIVFVGGYLNDKASGRSASQIATDYETIITILQAMSTDPLIICFGSPDPAGTNGSDFTAIDSAIKAKCIAAGVAWVSLVTGEVVNAAGEVVLLNGAWITTANKSTFIGTDNLHPNDAGHAYLAHRFLDAYLAVTREPDVHTGTTTVSPLAVGEASNRSAWRSVPELFSSFATVPDGPVPNKFDSGQPASVLTNAVAGSTPIISNGVLTFAPTTSSPTAGYYKGELSGDCTWIGARVKFAAGSTHDSSVVLAICKTEITSVSAVPTMALHAVIGPTKWEFGYWDGPDGGNTGYHPFSGATGNWTDYGTNLIADDKTEVAIDFYFDYDNNKLTVFLPNGQSQTFTDSHIGSNRGRFVYFENYSDVGTTDDLGRFEKVWASSGKVFPPLNKPWVIHKEATGTASTTLTANTPAYVGDALSAPFLAPSSGSVKCIFQSYMEVPTDANVYFTCVPFLEGATPGTSQSRLVENRSSYKTQTATVVLTGLTPGSWYQVLPQVMSTASDTKISRNTSIAQCLSLTVEPVLLAGG